MSGIIDAMLKLSRVSRSEIRRERIDLTKMANRALQDFMHLIGNRDLQYNVAENLVLNADRSLARILLDNLLHNALKFTAGNYETRIEIGVSSKDGREYVYVADNGVGFDMRHAGKLFQAFQRLHADKEFDGLGIGLATVHRVITRHGGEIYAEAKPGAGAKFYFRLD